MMSGFVTRLRRTRFRRELAPANVFGLFTVREDSGAAGNSSRMSCHPRGSRTIPRRTRRRHSNNTRHYPHHSSSSSKSLTRRIPSPLSKRTSPTATHCGPFVAYCRRAQSIRFVAHDCDSAGHCNHCFLNRMADMFSCPCGTRTRMWPLGLDSQAVSASIIRSVSASVA